MREVLVGVNARRRRHVRVDLCLTLTACRART